MTRGKDLTPITGAMCWRGEDLSKDDGWIREFTDSEIVELEIAVDATMNSPIQDIVSQTLPLPSLAIVLDQVRHELIDGHGFMLLRVKSLHELIGESAAISVNPSRKIRMAICWVMSKI